MATVVRHELAGCEGFRLECPHGLAGWVEETWLGAADEPVALVIRLIDGRDGLLLAEDVETVNREHERLTMRSGARLLELELPHVDSSSADGLSASWRTTGAPLELPERPDVVSRALLAIRPWRLAAPPRPWSERPAWVTVLLLYITIALIVALLIGLDFLVAKLVTGSAT
jgi:hypothetical protein